VTPYDDARRLMGDIERLLFELKNQAIDSDPEMHEVLREAKKEGGPSADDA
jgi:hypothetical protein